jgi:hypothetical protein
MVLAREHGLPGWADLKVRVAALEFTRAGGESQRAELVDAACAWGWDRPSGARTAVAEAMIARSAGLARKDLLVACLAGELEVARGFLEKDPALARSKLPPRHWEPLLYLSYCVLLGEPGPLSSRIVSVAKLLLDRGADPNASYVSPQNPSHVFPALYAAIAVSHNLDLARALLEAGANPNDGQSLYHAAEQWNTDALELLVAHRVSAADISYCLFHKIDFAHEPGIRWFLDHGADPNTRHPAAGETPLHWAIKRTCGASAIELLLARGSDPDAVARSHLARPRRSHGGPRRRRANSPPPGAPWPLEQGRRLRRRVDRAGGNWRAAAGGPEADRRRGSRRRRGPAAPGRDAVTFLLSAQ